MEVTPQFLAGLAGILISLLFEYVPKFHDWYNSLADTNQRLIMLGALVLVSAALYGMACAGWLAWIAPTLVLQCTEQGLAGLLLAFVASLVTNQATYLVSPKK